MADQLQAAGFGKLPALASLLTATCTARSPDMRRKSPRPDARGSER
jgi:hypothetical protein